MSRLSLDKSAIAGNFSRAAGGYDAAAQAQAEIARDLVRLIPSTFTPARIVDLCCGTGLMSGLLLERYPQAGLLGIDLAPAMVETCCSIFADNSRAEFIIGDAEDPSIVPAGVDLVTCSCGAQWFESLPEVLTLWREALEDNGILAMSVLSCGSFVELESAYRDALGSPFPGLILPQPGMLNDIAAGAGFTVRIDEGRRIRIFHSSALEALRSFKLIGAIFNGHPQYEPLTPGQMRRLQESYERQAESPGRVPVTYQVQYLVAEKCR